MFGFFETGLIHNFEAEIKYQMKKLILLSVLLVPCTYMFGQQNINAVNQNKTNDINKIIQFKETDHDFGKIPYGRAAEFDLEMKNVSNEPLMIQNVQPGCGCTTPKWQPGPYKSGESFKFTIGFNGYTEGQFNKIVTVTLSNGMSQVIKFHGQTYKAPDNAAPANAAIERIKSNGN